MGMAAQQHIPGPQGRQAVRAVLVAMGGIDQTISQIQQGVLRQHREFQHHLVHLRVAVAPHAQELVPAAVEHGRHLLGIILPGQIIAGAVVEDIPQQHQTVRSLLPKCLQQLFAVIRRAVHVRRDHPFHM